MTSRQRQFQAIRSNNISRCVSQISEPVSIIQRLNFQGTTKQSKDCIGCFNKNLAQSRRQDYKKRREDQAKEHHENIKRIQSMRDFQKQHRQRTTKQAAHYNRTLAQSQRESMKNLKKLQQSQVTEQIRHKQAQLDRSFDSFKQSRLDLKEKYSKQLKSQVDEQRQRKQLQKSRLRISNISQVNNLKVIEESEQYYRKMKGELKKCQQQNKSLMLEKSLRRLEEREDDVRKEKEHVQRVEKQFEKFTEFQQSFRLSKSSLSLTDNPEDVFTELKKIETQKKQTKINERTAKHNERMKQLKKLQEENRAKVQKKIQGMKSYAGQLASQLVEKRQRKAKQLNYIKNYQPEKSRVDYFTQESVKQLVHCGSCERVVEKKLVHDQ